MNKKIKQNNLFIIFLKIILIMLTTSFYSFSYKYSDIRGYSIYFMLICGLLILQSHFYEKKILTAYSMVLMFIIFFHFGQVFIYIFNKNIFLPVINFPKKILIESLFYCMFCVQIFDISYFIYDNVKKKRISQTYDNTYYNKSANYISKILIYILSPYVLFDTFKMAKFSLTHGYMSLYSYGTNLYTESELTSYIRTFFVVLCILYIVSTNFDFKKSKLVVLLLIIFSTLMFLSGHRSGLLGGILPITLMYMEHYNQKNSSRIKIAILFIILMFLSVFMSYYRLVSNKQYMDFNNAINYAIESNPIKETIIEMGGTLKALIYTNEIIPEIQNYRYGASYYGSIINLFPNLFNILGDVHPAANMTNLARWLMVSKQLSHGPGFSIIAESYYNFGSAGILVFIAWGILFNKLVGSINKYNSEKNFICYGSLSLILFLIRGTTAGFLRYFVYEIIILHLVIVLFSNYLKRKEKNYDIYCNSNV